MRVSAIGTSSTLLLATAATAFRDSSPLLVWSSEPNAVLAEAQEALTSGVIGADAIFGTLESVGCDWETVVVVRQDELHQTHLDKMSLPYESSEAGLHVPYLIKPTVESLDASVKSWAKHCGAEVVDQHSRRSNDKRSVVYYNSERGSNVELPRDLPARHIVVLTGTRDTAKRQAETAFETTAIPNIAGSVDELKKNETNGNSTHNGTHLLDRYELFSTPVILSVLISFGIILPILMLGISSLAAIQVPPRMLEISKTLAVKQDRKDQ